MSFIEKEYHSLNTGSGSQPLIAASRRHQTKLTSNRENHQEMPESYQAYTTINPNARRMTRNELEIYDGDKIRQIPKLRDGVHDEWKALYDLQKRDNLLREEKKKIEDSNKKKKYFDYLQDEMINKQRKLQENKDLI